ncbi:MAG: aromatic ring-hydroxylating dioxygenase subunit alpha [Rhodospirillaceae bacterium]|nr:ring-hydroxylating oxygenase subunit alpha [Rhodospirillaceae bacterium]RPG03099.1 MAG: aromatic ring-hydroxylating dioxygenase subunit alpha [Rhodospirillaceae bacterium TMED63]RZO36362.1 MAG: aromatic ring-hydroxylating dioxygenase subunit alpha [Rhodospirillaceae bacterium]
MLKEDLNRLVTQVGPDTGCGKLMRQYWQPAALTEELAGERPVKALTLMGEDLILYRYGDNEYGLIGRHCPHRGADLCFGRLEDGGLRCAFHGWLFDHTGKCLEQPAEPANSNFYKKIKHTAYPCVERNGIIFAYMGTGTPPALPAFDCFEAPNEFTFAFKGFVDCNWLQLNEVGIDPSHASFLHRFFDDETDKEAYGQQFRFSTEENDIAITKVLREYDCPEIDIEQTETGIRLYALRRLNDADMHVRVTNQIFPNAIIIPISNEMMLTQWHVPIDDTTSWWYAIFSSFSEKVDKERMRNDRLELYRLPDYRPRKNRDNDYGYDPEEQRSKTYTGMSEDINVHDQWAVESLGKIQDRTQEHLGTADKAIIANRKLLIRAIEAVERDEEPEIALRPDDPAACRGPVAIDTITPVANWSKTWKQTAVERRSRSAWAQHPWPADLTSKTET